MQGYEQGKEHLPHISEVYVRFIFVFGFCL